MNIYISYCNRKVKANIFNLPAVKTCKKNISCAGYCYARKSEKRYPGVLPCRERNYVESQKDTFVNDVITILKKRKNKVVRIHESGDFYSVEYIQKWFGICNSLPGYIFYTYTKRDDLFTSDILSTKPDNLTLIYSVDCVFSGKIHVEKVIGFDKVAIVHDTFTTCPAITNKSVKCGKQCTKCIDGKEKCIIFKKH